MAEHDAERAGRDEEREPRPPEEAAVPGGPPEPGPIDEAAAWEAIVAGYGEEPPDPPGARPFKSVEDLALLEDDRFNGMDTGTGSGDGTDKGTDKKIPPKPADRAAPGSSVVFAPGVGGPRDYEMPDPSDGGFDDPDDGDEDHFVPPEPPPLPEADATTKFAWLGAVGGPVLMLLAVLMRWDMTWWLSTLCIGGFLGGFVTLVARMPHDDEDDGDPGRGAVV